MLTLGRNILDSYLTGSPVPVYEFCVKDWISKCAENSIPFPHRIPFGLFYYEMEYPGMPKHFIVINNKLPNYKKLAVYFHERTHYECMHNNCKCHLHIPGKVSEQHAMIGAIRKSLDSGIIPALLFSMEFVGTTLFSSVSHVKKAGEFVVNDVIWEEARAMAIKKAGRLYLKWENQPSLSKMIKSVLR